MEAKNVHPDNAISPGIAENTAPAAVQLNNDEMASIRAFTPLTPAEAMSAGIPTPADRSNNARPPMPPAMPRSEAMPAMPPAPPARTPQAATPRHAPPQMPKEPETEDCNYKKGALPPCAPLAAAFVPFQQKNPPKYSAGDALTHGTLFPGLDLPFMNIANKNNPYAGTPLGEVMALDFAVHELTLYLDTHKDDKDAFDMLKSMLALSTKGRKAYERMFGPIDIRDLENADKFTWLTDPWPWEYSERRK